MHRATRYVSVMLALLCVILTCAAAAGDGKKSSKNPKLSTPLARLAQSVPQETGTTAKAQTQPQAQTTTTPQPRFSVESLPKSARDAVKTGRMRINDKGEVQVYIVVTEVSDANIGRLKQAGATVERTDKDERIVQARVPLSRLQMIASCPFVRLVRLPDYLVHQTGNITTEGDDVLKAALARAQLKVDGNGIRVGVISGGIAGVFAKSCTTCAGVAGGPIATDDLPDATGKRDASGNLISTSGGIVAQSFRADNDLEADDGEGTAMLEIVHDLAPSAQLLFANAATPIDLKAAVNFLAANADVVVDDLAAFTPPYDGTSGVSKNTAAALTKVANPIRAYITAVGNYANEHYEEDFLDSGTNDPSLSTAGYPGHVHLFKPTADTTDVLGFASTIADVIYLKTGQEATIRLTWNDPPGASTNDYDLFLVRSSTDKLEAWSAKAQTGSQDPEEHIDYINDGPEDSFWIFIQNSESKAAVRKVEMFVDAPPLPGNPNHTGESHNYNTPGSSIVAQSDAGGGVLAVGAAKWSTPDKIEDYSSHGPTEDGRQKPDVIATDGVSITGADGFGAGDQTNSVACKPGQTPCYFFGTSAAAPHAAAVAALLLQASPCLQAGASGARTPSEARSLLRKLLTDNAVDLGATGADNIYGSGRVDALAAVKKTVPTANAGADLTISGTSANGASATLDGSGSSDPNSCPLTFEWTGACGNGSGMSPMLSCPLGQSTESLRVTNNGVTFSDTSAVHITVTDFSIKTSASALTVNRGQSGQLTVTVSPQSGPFTNVVTLSCPTLPSYLSCAFAPPTVTPGAAGATSTLTITAATTTAQARPGRWKIWFGVVPAIAFVGAGLGRRRRIVLIAFALACLSALMLLQACGGGGGGGHNNFQPTPTTPTPNPVTSAITVTATSNSLQRTGSVTVTVQ